MWFISSIAAVMACVSLFAPRDHYYRLVIMEDGKKHWLPLRFKSEREARDYGNSNGINYYIAKILS
jgi:hypothetical protein